MSHKTPHHKNSAIKVTAHCAACIADFMAHFTCDSADKSATVLCGRNYKAGPIPIPIGCKIPVDL